MLRLASENRYQAARQIQTGGLVVRGSTKNFDGMRQKVGHSIERLHRPSRTARQVYNQRSITDSRYRARKHGTRIPFASLLSHEFAEPGENPLADRRSRFRSGIARPDSSAARGEN